MTSEARIIVTGQTKRVVIRGKKLGCFLGLENLLQDPTEQSATTMAADVIGKSQKH